MIENSVKIKFKDEGQQLIIDWKEDIEDIINELIIHWVIPDEDESKVIDSFIDGMINQLKVYRVKMKEVR